jgi:uncharacterized membrane protein
MVVKLAIAGVFAALVCVATLVLVVSVPATTGYFNIGETVIYVAASLFGPIVGAAAGGIGAGIADLLVAPQFAPGTLIIKGLEGGIVGFLNRKMFTHASSSAWKVFTTVLGIVIGILLAVTGAIYYSGEMQLFLGYPQPASPTFTVFVPIELWYFLGSIVTLLVAYVGFKTEPELGRRILSMMIGGLEMVFGYFLYEQLVLGKTTAIVEIPVNIGQMLVGLVVAIPIVKIILRSLPQLKN